MSSLEGISTLKHLFMLIYREFTLKLTSTIVRFVRETCACHNWISWTLNRPDFYALISFPQKEFLLLCNNRQHNCTMIAQPMSAIEIGISQGSTWDSCSKVDCHRCTPCCFTNYYFYCLQRKSLWIFCIGCRCSLFACGYLRRCKNASTAANLSTK